MAISCNAWDGNTVRVTDQISACLPKSALGAMRELSEETFLYAVLDALQRLAVAGVEGFVNLNTYDMCDAEINAKNASCALTTLSAPVQAEATEIKQQILWLLGNPLCTLDA